MYTYISTSLPIEALHGGYTLEVTLSNGGVLETFLQPDAPKVYRQPFTPEDIVRLGENLAVVQNMKARNTQEPRNMTLAALRQAIPFDQRVRLDSFDDSPALTQEGKALARTYRKDLECQQVLDMRSEHVIAALHGLVSLGVLEDFTIRTILY